MVEFPDHVTGSTFHGIVELTNSSFMVCLLPLHPERCAGSPVR